MNTLDIELYKVFAKKELVEGCKIQIKWEYIFTVIDVDGDIATTYHPLKTIKTQRREIKEMDISKLDGTRNKILGVPPTIENVFQKAKENGVEFKCMRLQNNICEYTLQFEDEKKVSDLIEYNPCLSLLNQTDETKQELLNLFK